jgi:hypothetical protein
VVVEANDLRVKEALRPAAAVALDTTKITTALYKAAKESDMLPCHVCNRMQSDNPEKHANLKTIGDVQTCLLCDRNYCKKHSGTEERVCEINHRSYYKKHPKLRDTVCFPSVAAMKLATYESGSDC